MQFYKLSFNLNGSRYEFTPTKYYYVSYPISTSPQIDARRVVMYSIKYINGSQYTEAEIPYYVSNDLLSLCERKISTITDSEEKKIFLIH